MSNTYIDSNKKLSGQPGFGGNKVVPTRNRWKSWRVNTVLYALVGLLLFLGTCEGARQAGYFSTSGRTNLGIQTVNTVSADPAAIKGSVTIQQVLTTYNISWDELSRQFDIPMDTSLNSPLNTLEKVSPTFSVSQLRTWIAEKQLK
jgi:hypothetical protein